ncbi:MAG: fasciclin domain-containing protein [Tunicatimonas sp.]
MFFSRLSLALALLTGLVGLSQAQVSSGSAHVMRDGQKFFPVGLYGPQFRSPFEEKAQAVDILATDGFNTIVLEDIATSRFGELLDQADQQGISVLVGITNLKEDEFVEETVTAYKDEPAVLGWSLLDDADNGEWTIDEIRARNNYLKTLDTTHFTYTTLTGYYPPRREAVDEFVAIADVSALQIYPIEPLPDYDVTDENALTQTYLRTLQYVQAAEQNGTPMLMNAQTFKWFPGGNPDVRYPTVAELRNMIYSGLAAGVDGIISYDFTLDLYNNQRALYDEYVAIKDDILKSTVDFYLEGELTRYATDDPALVASYYAYQDELLLITVNTSYTASQNVSIQLPSGYESAQPLFERMPATLSLSEDMIQGTLAPQAVQVYRLTKAGAEEDLVSRINSDPQFSTLAGLLAQTGLNPDLSQVGPFTVFAPTNEAFEKLDAQLAATNRILSPEQLTGLLLYYVVPEPVLVGALSEARTIETLATPTLDLIPQGGQTLVKATYNQARITDPDIQVTNGVIQAVDEVLLSIPGIAPENIVPLLGDDPRFTRLVSLLAQTGLDNELSAAGPFTLFAPTNDAFAQLDTWLADSNRILSPEQLTGLLLYHVVPDELLTSELKSRQTVPTLATPTLELIKSQGQVSVQATYTRAQVVEADLLAGNGVIHAIDQVLLSIPGIAPVVLTYCDSRGESTQDEWIAEVQIGDFTNTSGNNGGYQDFLARAVTLTAGESYAVTLTPGYTSEEFPEYWKIFVDLNQDGDFDDADELLFDAGVENIGPVTGTLRLPDSPTPDSTRLRVVMKYTTGDDPTIPEACEPFGFGEVEDFTLKVEGATVAPPTGSGLLAEYFVKNKKLKGAPVLTRTDSTVNFNWRGGSPDAQLPCDRFSVRWTGQVQAEYSETYTFITRSDDGVRLWVNGEQLIDNWTDHAVQTDRGKITLQAGQKYDIRLEYYENRGRAVCKLLWRSASQTRQVIPTARLFPADDAAARTADSPLAEKVTQPLTTDSQNVLLYPNPSADGAFTVQGVAEDSQVRMYDLTGREMLLTAQRIGTRLYLQPNANVTQGLYVVRVRQATGEVITRKLMVR